MAKSRKSVGSVGGRKVRITSKQKSARRKNIAIARSAKKKGGGKKKALTRAELFDKNMAKRRKEQYRKEKAVTKKHGKNLTPQMIEILSKYI